MSSSEVSDPQVYIDGEGKQRRRPGRPRRDPRGTQAELKAQERAAKREKERLAIEAKSETASQNRAYIQEYVSALFTENKVMIGDLLIGMLEHSIEVCGTANLAMTPEDLRTEATKALGAEVQRLISPTGVIEWQTSKLRQIMSQGAMPTPPASPSGSASTQSPLALGPSTPVASTGEIDIEALMEGGLPGYDDI